MSNGNISNGLVKIGANRLNDSVAINSESVEGSPKADSSNTITRRNFLKILGTAPAIGAVGCSDSTKHKAFSHVFGQDSQVPGVAVWYNSTCQECSSGCGITVRTREGRAVKIEGNREHPVNRGGLCALGQSSLQALYDPDRVRQPLKKVSGTDDQFEPITWAAAHKLLSDGMKFVKGEFAFLTGEQSGSIKKLVSDFVETAGGKRLVYDPMQPIEVAKASKYVYGKYGIPRYRFDRADLIVNFGADFLETWDSPCEYARDWADGRRGKNKARFLHIEPRLSLTGANADKWYANHPGGEVDLALFLLQYALKKGRGSNLADEVRESIRELTDNITLKQAAKASGLSDADILVIADRLVTAKQSLVLSGGSAGRTEAGTLLASIVALLNLTLQNIGKTVMISGMKKPESDLAQLVSLMSDMNGGKIKMLLVAPAVNPAFTLPSDYGFKYAVRSGRVKLKEALSADNSAPEDLPYLVSFSSHLDETARQADLILPAHHSLEDWGDSDFIPGVRSLIQPAMTPVFDTKSLGDQLLAVAAILKLELTTATGLDNFAAYVKNNWQGLYNDSGETVDFDSWWLKALEKGGLFESRDARSAVKVSVDKEGLLKLGSKQLKIEKSLKTDSKSKNNELILFPYFSVKSFDGRAANRPWLQEMPDPIAQVVWDSWAELHPDTAKQVGVKQGDLLTVRNKAGEINVPVYVTEHVKKGIVAVPIGQGHTDYGRYAKQVSGVGNVFTMLPNIAEPRADLPLVATTVTAQRALKKHDLVITQGSDYQFGRELARFKKVDVQKSDDHHDDHHGDGHHGGHYHHHEVKQMYDQRIHPIYEWVLAVDLSACTGCSACVTACYAENNIPVVGKEFVYQGREMSWLKIDRYYDKISGGEGESEELQVSFMPMMCQHCNNAPCEPVCPVYATYHNDEGLNVMVYNRCVGTRYCGNNCSYKVRRFNWFEFELPEPLTLQLNPDVTKRSAGVMEKCTFCIQRIQGAKDDAKDQGRLVADGEVQPACVQSCPTQALTFGNINDKNSKVYKASKDSRAYKVLDHHLNTQPGVIYLEDVKFKV